MTAVGLAGCGSGGEGAGQRENTVAVSGVVTFNNAPVEGATVTFSPGAGSTSKAAFGVTNADGKYQLTTYAANDGAIPGSYSVTIAKQVTEGRAPDPVNEEDYKPPEETEGKAPPVSSVTLLPPKYASPTSSGLKAEVKSDGAQTFDFPLKP
jgi:hypothetical protein